jgi:UbiD family decarboxylase
MFTDLRSFLTALDQQGQLARIRESVDPNQEIAVIQHHVLAAGGPALLFERVKGSPYRLVSNLFGSRERVRMVFGSEPSAIGNRLACLLQDLMPPSVSALWRFRKDLLRLLPARMRTVADGPVLATATEPADLSKLPVLTCWPQDGGPFFTWPLVHTTDPQNGRGNLGVYRLQRFDRSTTGMHWQIERGGGFHFHRAVQMDRALPVSVVLGGPPALTIAAVSPLPENIDERLLAAYLMGKPLAVVRRPGSGHRIAAHAEFLLEGEVRPGDLRREGPFGDHFGHYSAAADFPVFRVRRVLARKNAIYPATVVGKPVQEDYYIGEALQELTVPLLKLIRPAVTDLWAYPECGFHGLAAMSVAQRYPHEALKHTLGLLGEGHVSMTKVMITVGPQVDVRDFEAVSRAVWRNLSSEGLHLLAPTAQDTLDFTGPAMNTGSRLILIATPDTSRGPVRRGPEPEPPATAAISPHIRQTCACGPAFLLVQVAASVSDTAEIRQALQQDPAARRFAFIVLVSEDVPLTDPIMRLWGWFTRFDPNTDLHPAGRRIQGNRLLLDFPIVIDARWKKGYPRPVAFDPQAARAVARRWPDYGLGSRPPAIAG